MPDNYAALLERLWEIKNTNGTTISDMAGQAGLYTQTLWRVMHGERRPSFDTTVALLGTFPQLADLFLPPDVPNGTVELPEPQAQGEPV